MSSLDHDQLPVDEATLSESSAESLAEQSWAGDASEPQPVIWRSLEELEGDPEFLERLADEFPEHTEELQDPLSRRRFMQLMGASMAMTGVVASGCRRWEKDKLVPRDDRKDFIPGIPKRYTSAMDLGGVGAGVLVTAYDGRPIKIEGNPSHPYTGDPAKDGPHTDWNHGPTSAFAQASVLEVYDPDRSTGVMLKGGTKPIPFKQFEELVKRHFVPMQYLPEKWAAEAAKRKADAEKKAKAAREKAAREKAKKEGKPAPAPEPAKPDAVAGAPAPAPYTPPPPPVANTKVRFLSEASSSPTVARLRAAALKAYPGSKWYEWEPLTRDNERQGTAMAFGKPMRPLLRLDKADVIVCLDAELFVEHPSALTNAAGFGARRDPDAVNYEKSAGGGRWVQKPLPMNRLYAVESLHTQTGAVADHRLPVRSDQIGAFASALSAAIDGQSSSTVPGKNGKAFLDTLVGDLRAAKSAVVVAGYRQPPEVHAVVAYINSKLASAAVDYVDDPDSARKSHVEELAALVADIKANECETLIIIGGNPVYDSPADLGFAAALGSKSIKQRIHLSAYHNETSVACDWHLNRAHYLEAWGDARSYDGTVSIAQPIIEPIHGGKSTIELLGLLLAEEKDGRQLVRDTFDQLLGKQANNDSWRSALHDGFVPGTQYPVQKPGPAKPAAIAPAKSGAFEVVFTMSPHTYDGRFANNAWLLETPEFLSKMTWDNVLYVGVATAKQHGLKNRTWATLTVGGKSLKVGVYVLPGVAPGTLAIALGHGRTRAGYIGGHSEKKIKPAGVDTYTLRSSKALYIAAATISGSGEEHPLATTQGHWDIEPRGKKAIAKRMHELVKIGSKQAYEASRKKGADGVRRRLFEHTPHNPNQINKSLFQRPEMYDTGPKWGLTTDLSKCIGCNACLVACQAENNIPVVGKEQVMRNREMNWIRIDTYFLGDPDEPEVTHQPVMCQQCENAPCEQVCPVGATVHTDEGLNDMVYNRCVGTRYCLNNCPYKVRRFNFLDFQGRGPLSIDDSRNKVRKLLFNPNVTVRSRGVMEKCTFCVQRIQTERIAAKNQAVQSKAAALAAGEQPPAENLPPVPDGKIQTACMQVCPTRAITFGDLNDSTSKVYRAQYGRKKEIDPKSGWPVIAERAYKMMPELHTQPRNLYLARVTNPNPKLKPSAAAKKADGKAPGKH